jgi:hypothetical protein
LIHKIILFNKIACPALKTGYLLVQDRSLKNVIRRIKFTHTETWNLILGHLTVKPAISLKRKEQIVKLYALRFTLCALKRNLQ